MIKKIINYIKEPYLKIIYFNNTIDIINYDKILEIKDNLVIITIDDKKIMIHGNDLKLKKMLDDEILITGLIKKIEM